MSASKKSSSWWDNLLYIGIFILAVMFLYQLLKLWSAGEAKLSNLWSTFSTAAGNTLSAIESGFSTLLTSPLSLFSSLFSSIPNFFTWALGLLAGFSFSGLTGFIQALFSGPTATDTSTGSATAGTSGAPDSDSDTNSLGVGGAITDNGAGNTFSVPLDTAAP